MIIFPLFLVSIVIMFEKENNNEHFFVSGELIKLIPNEWVTKKNVLLLLSFFFCPLIVSLWKCETCDEGRRASRHGSLINFSQSIVKGFSLTALERRTAWWPNKSSLIDSHRMLNRWNYTSRKWFYKKRSPFIPLHLQSAISSFSLVPLHATHLTAMVSHRIFSFSCQAVSLYTRVTTTTCTKAHLEFAQLRTAANLVPTTLTRNDCNYPSTRSFALSYIGLSSQSIHYALSHCILYVSNYEARPVKTRKRDFNSTGRYIITHNCTNHPSFCYYK